MQTTEVCGLGRPICGVDIPKLLSLFEGDEFKVGLNDSPHYGSHHCASSYSQSLYQKLEVSSANSSSR